MKAIHFYYFFLFLSFFFIPATAIAATTGGDFQELYDFFFEAATGYLGRAIAIIGGLMGLGVGAATGKPIPALMGVVLAVFGTLGPTLINNLFASATI
ncbi:MAG: conjugal transfer protein TraB [Nitrospira sp. SB0677_bin_15]|nr:conjugal transfer protein TraB [Nitrospira sp. SB0667_bin_9]MYD30907.1 conjugal transfer protein TraB [Nitrospira sp. SB0661_bin_20]MYG39481.1 conjugal transfer protein TraB [Nitrospira sp. SB0677_bin_15]MYH01813.1 conjugal transfer protein TraB [Nitrospira sp. SB0675_bin_23]MYJ22148.1 conjugal transfer protein TraB [Nitrospira sp. SB0673_bin_12]